jgi:hypothetical protein
MQSLVDTTVEPGVTLTQDGNNWTLNFGVVDANSVTAVTINLVNNDAGLLKTTDDVTPPSDGEFIQSISNIGGFISVGGSEQLASISPDTSVIGPHTESIVIHSIDNPPPFTMPTQLPDITLMVTDNVVLPTDIFWQNKSSGQASVWEMDGNT